MADGRAQMSRVQRELLELKQRGRVKTQADKLKDCKLLCYSIENCSSSFLIASDVYTM